MIIRKVFKDKFIILNPKDLNLNNIDEMYGENENEGYLTPIMIE